MKRMVLNIQPFIIDQTIEFYDEDGIKSIKVPLEKVVEEISCRYKNEGYTQLDLAGNRQYAEKIKQDLTNASKFGKLDLNITIH